MRAVVDESTVVFDCLHRLGVRHIGGHDGRVELFLG